jgi:hypothetical protein
METHIGKNRDAKTEGYRIYVGVVSPDAIGIFKGPDATQTGWRRDPRLLGEFHIGNPAIIL